MAGKQQAQAQRLFLGLAMSATIVLAVVLFIPREDPTELSETEALRLAEGKESLQTRQAIANGGAFRPIGLLKNRAAYVHAMNALHSWAKQERMLRYSHESRAEAESDGIQVKALSRRGARRANGLNYFINSNAGNAANLNGGDADVPVSAIKAEMRARPAPVLSESKKYHILQSALQSNRNRKQGRHQKAAIRAFLDSNGDADTAARVVAQGHVGDELLTGGTTYPSSTLNPSLTRGNGLLQNRVFTGFVPAI